MYVHTRRIYTCTLWSIMIKKGCTLWSVLLDPKRQLEHTHLHLDIIFFSLFFSRNLSRRIYLTVYLRIQCKLVRIISSLWNPKNQTFNFYNLLHFYHYAHYYMTQLLLKFLLIISICRLGIFILQKERKILATMPVISVRLLSILYLHQWCNFPNLCIWCCQSYS